MLVGFELSERELELDKYLFKLNCGYHDVITNPVFKIFLNK